LQEIVVLAHDYFYVKDGNSIQDFQVGAGPAYRSWS